ncbi:hypothetical protein LNP04_12210 [Chryseobacterium sp. C-71]|uniref:hypothetical protein n=1 Tax=Chryseobacterium sp. C-71 TaxID=2893882 RepID=UPI001E5F2E7A|nr:hypothetical protein [Chryseobacterium sp. C-71]UFH30738.1 hypothetical protein LNP04_12210 [Chryseobacterium sp. C-71]
MKYSFTVLLLLLINLSCISRKKATTSNCTDYSFYYNYTGSEALKQIKDIPNLKEIDEHSLNSYLEMGNNFEEINKNQIVFVPRSEFFQIPDRKGDIPLYVLGYIQNNHIKQYLAFELHVGQNSSLYIINQINDKVTSMFLAHSNYNSGYGGENVGTKKISDSIFNVKVFHSYDTIDRNGNSSETCNYQLTLSDEGYLNLVQ